MTEEMATESPRCTDERDESASVRMPSITPVCISGLPSTKSVKGDENATVTVTKSEDSHITQRDHTTSLLASFLCGLCGLCGDPHTTQRAHTTWSALSQRPLLLLFWSFLFAWVYTIIPVDDYWLYYLVKSQWWVSLTLIAYIEIQTVNLPALTHRSYVSMYLGGFLLAPIAHVLRYFLQRKEEFTVSSLAVLFSFLVVVTVSGIDCVRRPFARSPETETETETKTETEVDIETETTNSSTHSSTARIIAQRESPHHTPNTHSDTTTAVIQEPQSQPQSQPEQPSSTKAHNSLSLSQPPLSHTHHTDSEDEEDDNECESEEHQRLLSDTYSPMFLATSLSPLTAHSSSAAHAHTPLPHSTALPQNREDPHVSRMSHTLHTSYSPLTAHNRTSSLTHTVPEETFPERTSEVEMTASSRPLPSHNATSRTVGDLEQNVEPLSHTHTTKALSQSHTEPLSRSPALSWTVRAVHYLIGVCRLEKEYFWFLPRYWESIDDANTTHSYTAPHLRGEAEMSSENNSNNNNGVPDRRVQWLWTTLFNFLYSLYYVLLVEFTQYFRSLTLHPHTADTQAETRPNENDDEDVGNSITQDPKMQRIYLFFVFIVCNTILRISLKSIGMHLDKQKTSPTSMYFIAEVMSLFFYYTFYRVLFESIHSVWEFIAFQALHLLSEWALYVGRVSSIYYRVTERFVRRFTPQRMLALPRLSRRAWRVFIALDMGIRCAVLAVTGYGMFFLLTTLQFAPWLRSHNDLRQSVEGYTVTAVLIVIAVVLELVNAAAMSVFYFKPRGLDVLAELRHCFSQRYFALLSVMIGANLFINPVFAFTKNVANSG